MNAAAAIPKLDPVNNTGVLGDIKTTSGSHGPRLVDVPHTRSLHAFLGQQAEALLDWTVNAELEALLSTCASARDRFGRPAVVRNGYQPARVLVTNLGPVLIRLPKVRSRTERPIAFRSALARPYLRRTRAMMPHASAQFVHGLACGDFHCAIAALMGPEAAALPVAVMHRVAKRWEVEHKELLTGSLAEVSCIALWAESLTCGEESPGSAGSVLMAIGIDAAGQERMLAARRVLETTRTWADLFRDLRRRGLRPPRQLRGASAAAADAAAEVYPETSRII